MATKKKNSYIDLELKWLEGKAAELKKYCDDNKVSQLTDRVVAGKVVQNIEGQIKCLRETFQDYIKIVAAIAELREKETSKKADETRGDQVLSPLESGEF